MPDEEGEIRQGDRQDRSSYATLTDVEGGTYQERLIPRSRAEEIISELADDGGEVGRLAYREALPSMAANIVGSAILDLKNGQVHGSCYVEGHRGDPGYDHEIILCEYDAESYFRCGAKADYDYSALLSDDEAREFISGIEARGQSVSSKIISDDVRKYLSAKGESLEDREEEVFGERLRASKWPDWDDVGRQLDGVYA